MTFPHAMNLHRPSTLNEKSVVALPEREMKQKLLTNQKLPLLTAEKGRNSFPRSTMAMTWFIFATGSQNSPNRASSSIPSERLEQESTCHLSLSTGINNLTVGLSGRKWEFSLFSERYTTNPRKELLLGALFCSCTDSGSAQIFFGTETRRQTFHPAQRNTISDNFNFSLRCFHACKHCLSAGLVQSVRT